MWPKPHYENFEDRLAKANEEKRLFEQEQEIRQIKRSMRRWHPPTTTKILMAYIFANCTAIEIYSMVAMWNLQDLSALYSLITSVVAESLSFGIYCAKAYNETKQEELIKMQRETLAAEKTSGEVQDPEAKGPDGSSG